jgi:hypothetical protein
MMKMLGNAEQYVAFIDVLGFSSLIDADFDGIVKVYDKMIESTAVVENLMQDVSLRVFSDAFVMASPQLPRLVGAVQGVLMQTLFNDLLVRGGVGFGRHIEKSGEGRLQVVSQALVKAVKTEKRIIYPCVALDESVVTDENWWPRDVPNQHRGLLYFDGIRLVNPCNVYWGQSARMRVLQLRELHPIHAAKHDWFLRLHSAIMSDEPLVPPMS